MTTSRIFNRLLPLAVVGVVGWLCVSIGTAAEGDGAEDGGPWYVELAGEPPMDETHDGVTWTYVGQYVFDDPDFVPTLDEREPHTGVELQMAAVRVDDLGREWHVKSIDADAVQASVDEYAAGVADDFDADDYSGWVVADQYEAVREGSVYGGELTPTSWTNQNCGGGGLDLFVWDSESRVETTINGSSSIAIQSSVTILQDGGFICSGSFVDEDGKVLTAAHCVTNDNTGAHLDPDDFQVCTRGKHYSGWDCYDVTEIVPDPSYPGSNWNLSYVNDLAVMSVDLGTDSIEHLPLSTHSTSSLEGSGKALDSYPEWIENGSGNCLQNDPTSGQLFFRESGADVVAATTGLLKTRLDSAAGASGSGITHTVSGTQFHAGVMDGYVGDATAWTGGARTSANTTFINSNP